MSCSFNISHIPLFFFFAVEESGTILPMSADWEVETGTFSLAPIKHRWKVALNHILCLQPTA